MAIQELNLATSEKQDKILSNFPINGGTDWSKYQKQVVNDYRESGVPSGSKRTILDITGEGALLTAISGAASYHYLKVKIDNKVVFYGRTGSLPNKCGLSYGLNSYPNGSYPHIDTGQYREVINLMTPLFFKNSLIIEIETFLNTGGIDVKYAYLLG